MKKIKLPDYKEIKNKALSSLKDLQALRVIKEEKAPAEPNAAELDIINQESRKEAVFYFNTAHTIWHWTMLSLPLDLLILLIPISTLPELSQSTTSFLEQLTALLAVLTLGFCFSEKIMDLLSHPTKIASKLNSNATLLLILVLAAVLILPNIAEILEFGLELIIPGIVIVTTILSFYKSAQESFHEFENTRLGSRKIRKEYGSRKIFYIYISGLTVSRLLSLSAFITSLTLHKTPDNSLLYFALSGIALISLQPQKEDYISVCRGCAIQASKSVMESDLCPRCQKRRKTGKPSPEK